MPDRRTVIPDALKPKKAVYKVSVSTSWLRREPAFSAPIESQLLFGERFNIYQDNGSWVWGQAEKFYEDSPFRGYVGWVKRQDLSALSPRLNPSPSYRVNVLKAPLFMKADIKSPYVRQGLEHGLPLNARVEISDRVEDAPEAVFFKLQDRPAYIHHRHVQPLDLKAASKYPISQDYVNWAETLMGLPYVWGGVSTFGLDCSGLVQTALRASRHDAPRDADQQEAELGSDIGLDLSGLKRGDLIFWPGHVGIMRSSTHLLHANAYHMCVASEPIGTAVRRIETSAGPIRSIRRLNPVSRD